MSKFSFSSLFSKKYEDTIVDYDKAIELNPEFTRAYCNRGISKFLSGNKDGACTDWSKAGKPDYTHVYDFIKKHGG